MRNPLPFVATAMLVAIGGCVHKTGGPPPVAPLTIVPLEGWPSLADDLDPESLDAACGPSVSSTRSARTAWSRATATPGSA